MAKDLIDINEFINKFPYRVQRNLYFTNVLVPLLYGKNKEKVFTTSLSEDGIHRVFNSESISSGENIGRREKITVTAPIATVGSEVKSKESHVFSFNIEYKDTTLLNGAKVETTETNQLQLEVRGSTSNSKEVCINPTRKVVRKSYDQKGKLAHQVIYQYPIHSYSSVHNSNTPVSLPTEYESSIDTTFYGFFAISQ